jgi:hypothetical protein
LKHELELVRQCIGQGYVTIKNSEKGFVIFLARFIPDKEL